MSFGLSDYARRFLTDEAATRQAHNFPVLIWESASGSAERDRVLMQTRTGLSGRRPRAGDPLIFEVKKGASKTNAFAMGITIGRTANNDVFIDDQSVSRFHAWLEGDGKTWKLTDAESKNGSWTGPLRLQPKKSEPVQDGARLRFGDVELRFLLPESFFEYLKKMMEK